MYISPKNRTIEEKHPQKNAPIRKENSENERTVQRPAFSKNADLME